MRDRDRDDLLGQEARLLRLCRPLVGLGRERVLLGACDPETRLVPLGCGTHGNTVEAAGQRLNVQGVPERRTAVPEAPPGAGHEMRSTCHRLHAARHHDLVPAQLDELGRLRDGGETGQAQLVERRRRCRHRHPATYGGQPGRVGADARLDHVPHDDGVDVRPGQPRATECLPDGDPAEVGCAELGEGAEQSADRSAGPGDEYCLFHVSSFLVAGRVVHV